MQLGATMFTHSLLISNEIVTRAELFTVQDCFAEGQPLLTVRYLGVFVSA